MKIVSRTLVYVTLTATAVIAAASCSEADGEMSVGDLSAGVSVDATHDHTPGEVGVEADAGLINTIGDVPDVEMIDISTGATVNLQSFVTNEKPLLFWFWAPH